MRRQLLSFACGLRPAQRVSAPVLLSLSHHSARSHVAFHFRFSSTLSSSPLLAPDTPSTSEPTATTPASASSPGRPSIRKFQRLWTPDYVSPSKHLMNYLTQHGPQTRRTLYAIFGPTPSTSPPTSSSSPASPASTEAAEAIAASPVVQSHPSCLRSKSHLTTLLQQLTRSGRVLTKRAPATTTATTAAGGGGGGRKAGALYVYEMRDYETSWNKIRHEKEKGQKGRKKQERLQVKAKEEEERAATKERRRQRLEAGMSSTQ